MTSRLGLALLGGLMIAFAQPARGETPLSVCLQTNDPPLSYSLAGKPLGFDVALAGLIADRLNRPLEIQWFVTRNDPDSDPMTEAAALLSDGHCALVGGYPLLKDKLGHPRADTGKLPLFAGAKPEDRGRWIHLGELVPTRPYRLNAITVALTPRHSQRTVHALTDLEGLSLGVQTHSLADLIASSYRQGELAPHVVHFDEVGPLFTKLETGELDAALVDQREFDAWRLANPQSHVIATGYRHSIGFNIGFVGLPSQGPLIEAVDKILDDLIVQGRLEAIARANTMTYLPPQKPDVLAGFSLSAITGD